MTLLAWGAGRLSGGGAWPWLAPGLVAAGVAASLFYFNRDAEWDVWAPYFFGSYGLGALALLLAAMLLLPGMALLVDFRSRIALALAVACLLFLFGRYRPTSPAGPALAVIDYAGKISFSVFLVHFPVCLVVNATFARFVPEQAHAQAFGMLVGWMASLLAGVAFFRWVETPLGNAFSGIRPSPALVMRPRSPGR